VERIQSASDFRPITVLSAVFRKEKRGEWVYALFEGSAPWESLKDFHLRRAREVAERPERFMRAELPEAVSRSALQMQRALDGV